MEVSCPPLAPEAFPREQEGQQTEGYDGSSPEGGWCASPGFPGAPSVRRLRCGPGRARLQDSLPPLERRRASRLFSPPKPSSTVGATGSGTQSRPSTTKA
jgi:hypothetical protein